MQTIQQQFIAHQALINDVTARIERFEAELASVPSEIPEDIENAQRELVEAQRLVHGFRMKTLPDWEHPSSEEFTRLEKLLMDAGPTRERIKAATDAQGSYTHMQAALESAKREYLNLTGARYGE